MRGELAETKICDLRGKIEAMPFLIHFNQRLGLIDPRLLYIISCQR
jgi:hypothetical protein